MSDFNFGSRPITVFEGRSKIFEEEILFITDNKVFATIKLLPDSLTDNMFEVRGKEGKYLGTISGRANACVAVCFYYDLLYPTTPKLQEARAVALAKVWVVFAKISDGIQEANFSREVNAPDLEIAKETFLSEVHADQVLEPTEIITVYGPYTRVE